MLAHNGEINTLKGNLNWMKSHEIRMASSTFGDMAEDIKPIVAAGSSDSAALDSVFEVLVRAGRSAPMAKTMLIPESWSKQAVELPQAWRDMYSYCNSVMEPWDGPAALAMTDGRWVCAGLDRNGLRPMRYVVTADGMLIAGSEAGMVPLDEANVVRKGALGPGQMIGVHMGKGEMYQDQELKDKMSAALPFGEWVGKISDLNEALSAVEEKPLFEGNALRRRQVAAGYTIEELEQILAPMAEDGKETLASMGDDTPSAVLSNQYRPLSHFFRQNFSQVTNPPIDSLREYRVMSLKTRFGNLKNVLDEDSSQTEILVLDSPFVGNAQFDELARNFNADLITIDCTFEAGDGNLNAGLARIRDEAEDAVRSGAGHIVLTDQHSGEGRVAMPMILATSAVHSSGIGVTGIQRKAEEVHQKGWQGDGVVMPIGGFYKSRKSGETHAWEASSMHMLQMACNKASYAMWQQYSAKMQSNPPIHLRDLLDIKPMGEAIGIEEVESITAIRKRFVTPGMSLGALSPEAHKTLNVAMNRIGAKSDSGEGGEDPAHFVPEPNGDNPSAKIKQVASGRFGVTAEYLNQCEELEIKVAQGAKPGEGGQLPGMKVTDLIARLRHSTKGVTLISPPPHHDIYSIEDLAQLIYDLKQINPRCKVTVKLVASSGVGTIAAGVAKAKADVILISGHNGGTGASPATSIKYAGLPWEMGLTEAHQVLSMNNLRDRVTLRTDGGLRTGRDIVMAAMLGAEEYGIGTAALIAMGCIMVRQCQSNTCPVGVCTQDEALRDKFTGNADKVVNLITHYANEVREILASIGARSLDDVIGRADLLTQVSRGSAHLDDLDLNPLLITVDDAQETVYDRDKPRQVVAETLDAQIVGDAARFLEDGEKMQLSYAVQNTHRTVGTRISSHIVKNFGMRNSLQPNHLTIKLTGSAGQSLGAFAAPGLKLEVSGDANDYVGKGLSGGMIVVRPPMASSIVAAENTIIGNTVLYGATDGYLFAAGRAGERFAVRNSGAKVVIEGCDDPEGNTASMMNDETVVTGAVAHDHWIAQLKGLLQAHVAETGSRKGEEILQHWESELPNFVQVCPKEMLDKLPAPLSNEAQAVPAE